MMKLALFVLATAAGLPVVAQNFVPVDEGGYQKLIQSQKGSVVVIDFWATYCKPCRAEMPNLVKLEAKLHAKGLRMITVSADEPESMALAKKFLGEVGAASLPAYVKRPKDDDKFIDAIDSKWQGALPALFLYDRNGKKVHSFVGETPLATIEAAIQKLL